MEWTREQKSAIDCREEKSILLAAAAGSGKTAVLVERIISRIKDRENPLSVSELLVLTFTEAAASEMKRKIMNAIKSELEADPANEHLQRQSILLHSASISTVHSFCNKILKGHIHMTDLPAEFSLADETELNLLLKQAINQALEKYYARLDKLPSFSELCSAYGGVKGDGRLRELLCDLYLFSRSLPYPYEWLKNSVNTYKILCTEKSDRNTLWHAFRKAEEEAYISDILSCYDAILNVLESLPDDHKYAGFYQAEADLVKEVLNRLNDGDPEPTISFKFQTKVKKQNTHPAEEQTADKLRDLAKKAFDDLKEFLSSATSESAELSEKLYLRAKTLKSLMLLTDRIFSRLKKERGLLDFSDLEHGLLKLISDKHHNPTPVALELRKRYSEILLDEYQDTNNIQEEIFRLLSRDGKNIFMVGDLKQSIYKFRNAVPELFANKRKSYSENEAAGKLISLFKNFRSRKEVIGTVNFMFSALMTEALGDIDYNEPEFLVQGADYPEPEHEDDFTTEYYVITNDETPHPSASPTPVSPPGSVGGKRLPPASTAAQGEGFSAPAETEAALIAKRIEEIINSGLLVYNSKNGAKQRAQYRDIVILLRNRSNAALIEAALEERGIPAYSDSGSGYLGSPEVGTVLSFLNIIDNPCQDIPLIAVLRSRIFGFTPDELAEIRFAKQNCYFYDALKAAAESGSQKAADFIKSAKKIMTAQL